VDRDLYDILSLALDFLTLFVTAAGLGFVVYSLKQATSQQRVESGPYVRVDIADIDNPGDFAPPPHHFRRSDLASEISLPIDNEVVTVAAWFRNYQTNDLGMAFGLSATFLVEPEGAESFMNKVFIAYLEQGKPVVTDVLRAPGNAEVAVTLISLTYVDFFDHEHAHNHGEKGTNGLHGRLIYRRSRNTARSVPEARSMAKGVSYEDGN